MCRERDDVAAKLAIAVPLGAVWRLLQRGCRRVILRPRIFLGGGSFFIEGTCEKGMKTPVTV